MAKSRGPQIDEGDRPIMIVEERFHQETAPKRRLHPTLHLESLVPDDVVDNFLTRLAQELLNRGFRDPQDFKRIGAANELVAALQYALRVDAQVILSLADQYKE